MAAPQPHFDNRPGVIWMNGAFVPWTEARVHLLTHALHYASSVFEGERAYGGTIFRLEEHTQRLFRSAEILDMQVPYSQGEINAACEELLRRQGHSEAYVRPIIWRGSEMMGVAAQTSRINAAVAIWQWPAYFDPALKTKGLRLDLSRWRRPAPDTAPTQAKCAGLYMICTLSKHEAERKGLADALMLDYRGLVAEATGANVFFVKDGTVITPTPDCFLDGITRRTVMDLARARQMKVVERGVHPDELEGMQECFITGTAAEVTPVGEIGPWRFDVGRITSTLMADYDATVNGRPIARA